MRTNATDVQDIMGITLSSTYVDKYIKSANALVNQALASASLEEDTLTEIEMWIAAHMISVTRERQAKKEGAGGAEIEYTGEYGLGLNSTSFGQMAIALDSTGTLADLASGKKKATFYTIPQTY